MKRQILLLVTIVVFSSLQAQRIESIINNLTNDKQKADTILFFSKALLMKAKFDSANILLEKGLEMAQHLGDNALIVKYYLEQSRTMFLQRKKTNALSCLEKIKPYLHLLPEPLPNHYLMLKGKVYNQLNQPDSAFHYFKLSEAYNNGTDAYRNWTTYIEMAQLFDDREDFAKAEKYFLDAYQLTKTRGLRMDYGLATYQLVSFYYKWKETAKFANMLKQHQDFLKAGKKDLIKDPVHSVLFVDWGDVPLPTKVEFMTNVKKELLKNGFIENAAYANNHIVQFYEESKQYDEAIKYISENLELLKKDNDIENIYINTKIAYRLYKKAANTQEAAVTAEKLLVLKDSLLKLQQREMVFDLETKYQTDKKLQEIALLKSQNDIASLQLVNEAELKKRLQLENLLKDSAVTKEQASNQLLRTENDLKKSELEKQLLLKAATEKESRMKTDELQKEKSIRLLLISAVSLIALAGVAILLLYRKQRTKNHVIQKQADDLSILMKEIHHRVKNNLQIISSLLDLQSHSIQDSQASEAVKEGKNRVQSMALIHQNLYSEGNIKGIKAKEYVANLLQSLCDSYNITNDKVAVTTQIDDLNIDVDTMIPLGLVLNELVSNSLKYAFKEMGKGELRVVLKQADNHLQLRVSDNGIGFPAGIEEANNKSFGLKMIKAFAKKLKAQLSIYNQGGAVVEMQIAKYKIA